MPLSHVVGWSFRPKETGSVLGLLMTIPVTVSCLPEISRVRPGGNEALLTQGKGGYLMVPVLRGSLFVCTVELKVNIKHRLIRD